MEKFKENKEKFHFFGGEEFNEKTGFGILSGDEYLKRKGNLIKGNKNQVGNIVESDINLLGDKENLILELAELLNDDWKEIYKTQEMYGVKIFSDGSVTPRLKETTDEEWILKNGGKNIVDIANTNFQDLPNDWKKENEEAAKSALGYFIRHFKKGVKIDNDFIEEFALFNHNEWLKRNGRVFKEKKDSEDYYKDYNNSIEKEKDIQIAKRIIAFYAEKVLVNKLAEQLHLDWLELYKLQSSDGVSNYENGIIKPRLKETKDEEWISKNGGKSIVDIANTNFNDLPQDWKEENLISARETINSIFEELAKGVNIESKSIIEKLSDENHELWKKRNSWVYDKEYGNPKLAVKYSELDEIEKEKNRAIIKRTIAFIKEEGLLYEYKELDNNGFLEEKFLENIKIDNKNISEILSLFKNEDNRKYIYNLFKNYLEENKDNIEKIKNEVFNLDISNLLIFYRLLKGILLENKNDKLEELVLAIEEKYDNNLLFRYFRFFARTRFGILKEEVLLEKENIIKKYGKDFYKTEGGDYNLRYISNDIIAFSDEYKNIGTPLFYYKILKEQGEDLFKKIFSDNLLDGYVFFKDMEQSQEVDYKFLVQILHDPVFIKQIENQFGFNFKKMPFYLQPRFIKFLSESSFDEFDRLIKLFNSGKTDSQKFDRLNSFLGTYTNKYFSETILHLGESELLEDKDKNKIFKKYSKLLQKINEDIDFNPSLLNGLDKDSFLETLLVRLNKFFKNIDSYLIENNNDYLLKIITEIENTRKDFLQAGIIFSKLKDKNIQSPNELNRIGIDYKYLKLSELDEKEKDKIKKDVYSLYEEEYYDKKEYLDNINNVLLNDLFNNENEAEFYLFYINNKLILSTILVNKGNNTLYGMSFNSKNIFQEFLLGTWFLDWLLKQKFNNNILIKTTYEIEGSIRQKSKFLLRYYNQKGFNIIGKGENNVSKYYDLKRKAK